MNYEVLLRKDLHWEFLAVHETDHSDPETRNPENQKKVLAGYLHDLAQPLTVINNLAQAGLLISSNNDAQSPEFKQLFKQICEEARRAGEICRNIPR